METGITEGSPSIIVHHPQAFNEAEVLHPSKTSQPNTGVYEFAAGDKEKKEKKEKKKKKKEKEKEITRKKEE